MTYNPGQIFEEVEQGAQRLEKAADAYYEAVREYEEAENDFERELTKQIIAIVHESKQAGEKRPPAEDIRKAMALERIPQEVYTRYLTAKANREALKVRYDALKAAVSARQSLLKALGGLG